MKYIVIVLALMNTCVAGDALAQMAVWMPRTTSATAGSVLHASSIELLGVPFSDVVTTPRISGHTVALTDIAGRIFGGTASGGIRIQLDSGIYQGEIDIVGVDLTAVLRAHRVAIDGIGGVISATGSFTIDAANPMAMIAKGKIRIRKAHFLRLPALLALLYSRMNTTEFSDELDADFSIADGRIRVERAVLSYARDSEIRMRGTIGFDGTLNLAISANLRQGLLSYIPIIGDTAIWLSGFLARYSIRGHISNPELRVNPFGSELDQ